MTDLIERLRNPPVGEDWTTEDGLFSEAADEIELLRAKNESQADYIRVINRMVARYKKQLGEA